MNIEEVVQQQRDYFATGVTLPVSFRLDALRRLQSEIKRREADIIAALKTDLGRADYESYMVEIGVVLDELRFMIKHLPKWAKNKRVRTPISHFPSRSFISPQPYGNVLVMAPWNYPFYLSLNPVVGALAAGNCVVLKPSAYAPAASTIIREICAACFEPGHVTVVEGGRAENTALLEQRFDYIFFTGSVAVGKLVMERASRQLTPVTLELGGKSPCIVDETADIAVAGRRIAFGKFLNAGQTCVAPDYLFVQESVKAELLAAIKQAVHEFFGDDPLTNPELPKIINEKHFRRLQGLLKGETIVFGGKDDGISRIAPTVLDNVRLDAPIMQEEIFGPILPVLTFKEIGEATAYVRAHEKPLALYLFTQDAATQARVLNECSFGGGCINDTIVHLATSYMPFGGVGASGMGQYHGRDSFDTFTHKRSILKKSNALDLKVRYHPYTESKQRVLRFLMR